MGGDITGFLDNYSTIRYYSNNGDIYTVEILEDTVLGQSNYRKIGMGFYEDYYMHTADFIYKRIVFNNVIVNTPYLCRILVNKTVINEELETDRYMYSFTMNVDSLSDVLHNDIIFNNVYAVRTELILTADNADTVISNRLLLSGEYGIVGIYSDDRLFIMDSIIQ